MTLVARCSNCASWQAVPPPPTAHASVRADDGVCVKGFAPPPGALLCDRYAVSAAFRAKIVSTVLKHEPVRVDVGRKRP